METAECVHKEKPISSEHGVETWECRTCHQQTQIFTDKDHARPVLIKLGRLNGKVVLPKPGLIHKLDLQDQADLAAATKIVSVRSPKEPAAAAVPERPGKDDPAARLKWYKDNKRQMIEDLLSMGPKSFLKNWKIPPQLLSHLKTDKLYKKLAEKTPPAPEARARRPKAAKGEKIPQLPPWSDNWAPEVQVCWLNIFERYFLKK